MIPRRKKKDNMTKSERTHRYFARMADLGFSFDESNTIRRIERTLQRWGELECGDGNDYASWSIERDETTGKPYLVTHPHTGQSYRRLQTIMARHSGLWFFHQTDCLGCMVYIGRNEDVAGQTLESVYTRGLAACV